MDFYTYIRDELLFPWLLRGGARIAALIRLIASFLDAAAADAVYIMRQFHTATCDASYLEIIGKSRRMPRHEGETDAAYRTRLLNAFAYHRLGGKRAGYELAVKAAAPGVAVRVFVPGESGWVIGRDAIGNMEITAPRNSFEVMLIYPRGAAQGVKNAALAAAKSVKAARDKVYNQTGSMPPDPGSVRWTVGQTAIGTSYIN